MGNAYLWIEAPRERLLPMARKLLRFGDRARCGIPYMQLAGGRNSRSGVRYRGLNDLPVLLLAAIVVPVVVKPF